MIGCLPQLVGSGRLTNNLRATTFSIKSANLIFIYVVNGTINRGLKASVYVSSCCVGVIRVVFFFQCGSAYVSLFI